MRRGEKKRRNCEITIVLVLSIFCANISRSLVLCVYTNFRRFTLIVAGIICPQKIFKLLVDFLKVVGANLKGGDTGSYLI